MRVGDAIDFEVEDIVPFGVETGEPVRFAGMFHPAGSDLTMAEATRSQINAFGIEYEGKTGLSTSEFAWALRDRLGARTAAAGRDAGARGRPRAARARRAAVRARRDRLVVDRRTGCAGMDDGPWTALGTLGWFLGVWVVMMAAMMFPSLAPTVALYARMTQRPRSRRCCSPPATS